MSANIQQDVKDFQTVCDTEIYSFLEFLGPLSGSRIRLVKQIELCISLIEEECTKELLPCLSSLLTAYRYRTLGKEELEERLTEILDGAVDTVYVIMYMLNSLGFAELFQAAWDEIQATNMAKSVDGKVHYRDDGKILKPAKWVPPNLTSLIRSKL